MRSNEVRIFSGSEVTVLALKARLDEIGISSIITNEYQSSVMAGFFGGSASSVDLYVQATDVEKAMPIIEALTKS